MIPFKKHIDFQPLFIADFILTLNLSVIFGTLVLRNTEKGFCTWNII